MPLHKYKAAVQYAFTLANQHNVAGFKEQFDPASTIHDPSLPDGVGHREDVARLLAEAISAFPDARLTVDDIFGEGDKVVVRWTFLGTHQGEYQGAPPTGTEVKVSAATTFRLSGNRIQEIWQLPDRLGLLQQLGLA
jgi:steroid delta-isomerase-like uncharacterized protein